VSGLRRKTRQTSELIVSHSTLRSRRTTGVVWYDLGVNKVGLQSVFSSFSPLSSKRSFAAVLLCAVLFFSLLPSSQGVLADDGQTTEPSEPRISEGFEPSVKLPAVLVLDSSLRSELYAKNSEIVLEIPAVSRLMTLYLASERLAADDMIPISKDAARISEFEDHIDIPLREGDSFPVRYMLLRLMFQQSDAAAVALAEKIAGSRREFVSEMQKTAMMLGMSQTTIHRCDVVRAERESSIPSEIADAAAILEEHIAQNASGAPALPEASDRVSTAKTTLRDVARLLSAIQANARAKNVLSLQEELIQVTLSTGVRVVAMRSPASRLRTLSENRITCAWLMMSDRYSLAVTTGSTVDGISVMTLTASLNQASTIQPTLQLYQEIDTFYTKSVLTRSGEKYPGAPEAAENGELFSLMYLDSVDYIHPKTDHFLTPKLDYIGNAPYPLPILRGTMTGQVLFTLKDGTRIPVRVGSDSDILASNNIISRGIQLMSRNPNLAYSIMGIAVVLSLALLFVIIREIREILYWQRIKSLEDTVQAARSILIGEQKDR
jgi:hypothetical protein